MICIFGRFSDGRQFEMLEMRNRKPDFLGDYVKCNRYGNILRVNVSRCAQIVAFLFRLPSHALCFCRLIPFRLYKKITPDVPQTWNSQMN